MSNSKRLRTLCERFDWTCYYCEEEVGTDREESKRPTIDHKTPMSRGGSRRKLSNVVLACYECNHLKGDMTEEEFKVFKMSVSAGIGIRASRIRARLTYPIAPYLPDSIWD